MARILYVDATVNLGEFLRVWAANGPGGATIGDTNKKTVVAEALFKLAFAVLAGDVQMDMKVENGSLKRDPKWKFPTNPNVPTTNGPAE